MFKIGEFAQIGRVTGRQLRHYDQLGLLEPSHTDQQTGYRYYSARQLPRLNRLLALKALGFSLDQIGELLDGESSPEELRGMLSIRKAQVEQSLSEEQVKLRQIESRIQQIEEQGVLKDYDVTVRRMPPLPYASIRKQFAHIGEAVSFVQMVTERGVRRIRPADRGNLLIVAHSDFEGEALDLELGFTLTRALNTPISLSGNIDLTLRELEEVDTMASLVRTGAHDQTHVAYGGLGIWMEANDYEIAGLCREVFLELPFSNPGSEDVVMEIQFPVRKLVPH